MEIRVMATAFLFHDDQVLLMKKESSRIAVGPFWTGLGGHLEPAELNYPKKACIREIFEESGLREEDLLDLTLKYILLRAFGSEIRQQYVYFGKTAHTRVIPSDEGELYWADTGSLKELRFSKIISYMLSHYLADPNREETTVGVITIDTEGNPMMRWAEMFDPQVF